MLKFNKHTRKYNITEQNLIGFDEIIASIPKSIKKKYGIIYNNMARKARWFATNWYYDN